MEAVDGELGRQQGRRPFAWHADDDRRRRRTRFRVDGPIQLAVATADEAVVLQEKDLQPVRDTASAFRMHQADS